LQSKYPKACRTKKLKSGNKHALQVNDSMENTPLEYA